MMLCSETIKSLAQEQGLTQNQPAGWIGIGRGSLSNLLRGMRGEGRKTLMGLAPDFSGRLGGKLDRSNAGGAMKLVFICSPYRGDTELNIARAQRYCRYAYTQGTVPFAPHLHNTQFLEEGIPEEREAGIRMGLELLGKCDELWLFGSLLTEGMKTELKTALRLKKQVRYFNDICQEVEKNE